MVLILHISHAKIKTAKILTIEKSCVNFDLATRSEDQVVFYQIFERPTQRVLISRTIEIEGS